MHIGIDFGTSYSAAATFLDDELTLVRFGQAKQFRTAVFFPEVVPDPNDFELTPEREAQLEVLLRSAHTQQRQLAAEARQRGSSYRSVPMPLRPHKTVGSRAYKPKCAFLPILGRPSDIERGAKLIRRKGAECSDTRSGSGASKSSNKNAAKRKKMKPFERGPKRSTGPGS